MRAVGRVLFKITDGKKTPPLPPPPRAQPAKELTADERFFAEHDEDPTSAFIESLERERAVLEEKERHGEATPEWKAYEKEVEAVIKAVEDSWLVNPEPISKDSVKRAHAVMDEAVRKVQDKHQKINDQRIEAYREYRRLRLQAPADKDAKEPEMPVSPEFARLLDKFT